jgi:hypothetical protein
VEKLRAKGRWINVELSERDKDTDKEERRERIKGSRYNREYERFMTEGIPEFLGRERVQKKEKWDLSGGTRGEETGIGWKERKKVLWGERETIEHMWNGCNEMRKRKSRGEIQNEDRRLDKMDERDMEEEGKDRKRKVLGIVKKC